MPGKPVRIGPFTDGLNNVSQSGESKDTELVEMVNFEVGPDNLLWSRPPFEVVADTLVDGALANWKILGVYRHSITEWYAVVAKPKSGGASDILGYLSGDFTSEPIVIKSVPAGNEVTGFVQWNTFGYFCVSPSSTIASFKWSKSTTAADLSQMKKGFSMVAFKDRLWIAGIDTAAQNSTIYFSSIGTSGANPDIWNQVDFINVAPGEGGFITALLTLNSSIMVFKNDGTWRFTYPSSPSKGQVDKISGSVGAAGANSVIEFENYVYVYDQGRLYELVNSTFTQLNRFVRFEKDTGSVDSVADGVDVSIVNRRLIVRYYNNIYAYSIDSQAWSQWRSYMGTPGKLYELPTDSASTESSTFIAASAGRTQAPSTNAIPAFTQAFAADLNAKAGTGNLVSSVGTTIEVSTSTSSTTVLAESILLSTGQKWKLVGDITKTGGTIAAVLDCLLRDGTSTSVSITLDLDAVSKTFTVPDQTISGRLSIVHTGTDLSYSMTGMQFNRLAGNSPATVIKVQDDYNLLPISVENIVCRIRTKSYDFQAPSVMKRLFWWGADIKTNQLVTAKLIPNAIKLPPTWGALRAYTHLELRQGTWGNPLSFKQNSLEVVDGGDPRNAITENGRIFMKLVKSIRFKQLSFELQTSTLGSQATGPCKIHTITAYVMPKEKVVDKFN